MTRLPDKRKERSNIGDSSVSRIVGSNELGRGSRLTPLPPSKSTRLPPLKPHRLPDISLVGQTSETGTPILPAKPELDTQPNTQARSEEIGTKPRCRFTHTLNPGQRLENGKRNIESKQTLREDNANIKSRDVATKSKNDQVNKNEIKIKRHSPVPPVINDSKVNPKPSYQTTKYDDVREVTWVKERELLRRHRKQQAERRKEAMKPLKATMKFDNTGKEIKSVPKSEIMKTERKKVDLTARRKCDDDDDWDWDKDIEEFMNIEDKEKSRRQSTSDKNALTHTGRENKNEPIILNCTKKGVGFKSKKRLEEERRIEQQRRIEQERIAKETKEKIDLMVPLKIKKDLKKYGFR